MLSDQPPLIVHVVHSLRGGGTERTLVHLLDAVDRTRFRHRIVTLRDCGALVERLPDHVACRPINAGSRNRLVGLQLAKLIRKHRAGIVHARGIGCWFDAMVAGLLAPRTQVVLGFHGLEAGPSFDGRQRRRARWGLYSGARFTSVSLDGKRQLQLEAGIPEDRIEVLPNGVDLLRFRRRTGSLRGPTRATWRFEKDAVVVGIVATLTPVKRHATLIKSVARVVAAGRNLHLFVVGDGPLRGELVELARSEGIEHCVTFAGWSEDVSTLLSAMDVYVCCSNAEGMNNAVLEAMAAGLPIIATDVGDNPVVVRHDREGLIVQPESSAALTDALSKLTGSGDLRKRYAAASLQRVQCFDFRRTVRSYERYYEGLLHGGETAIRARTHRPLLAKVGKADSATGSVR